MAWTAPMTATDSAVFTSTQFNQQVRDNLLETMPGKASAAGNWFAVAGTNSIAQRTITEAVVATSQTTSSTSYTDLTTVGPSVTATTGTNAIVFFAANMANNTLNVGSNISVAVSGATTIAANNQWRACINGSAATQPSRVASFYKFTTLTAGSNTFTVKYRADAGTSTFFDRTILVMPL